MSGATRQLWDHVPKNRAQVLVLEGGDRHWTRRYQRLEQVAGRVVGMAMPACQRRSDCPSSRNCVSRGAGLGEDHLLVRKRLYTRKEIRKHRSWEQEIAAPRYGRRPTETSTAAKVGLGRGAFSHRRTHRRKSGYKPTAMIRIPRRTAEGSVRSCVAQGSPPSR